MSTEAEHRKAAEAAQTKQTGSGATASPGDKKLPENSQENLDRKLDQAAEESFPSSDPVSVKITK